MNLEKLLRPDKICVVGASERNGFGGDTCRNIIDNMEKGSYYLVNPKRDTIFEMPCYHSIEEVPGNFDLVVICTPWQTVADILIQAAKKGAGGAIVFASGYSEMNTEEGRENQQSLIELCKSLDIALMGPNCAGYINFTDGKYPFAFLSEKRDRRGAVGLISQSGQICLTLMDSPNMKFSYVISSGNSAVAGMEDYMEFLIEDPSTKVVAMYLEGIKQPDKFIRCLKAAALKRKPIVVLKAGRSEKGSKLAASHTGSMAGADKVFDALFLKYGVIRVDDIEELLATSLMFSILPKMPEQSGVASMNLSGGETGICADVGSTCGADYPDFSHETIVSLKEQLPFYANPANPLDMTATLSYDIEKYAAVLRTVMKDPKIGIVAIGYTLLETITDQAIYYMTAAIEIVAKEPDSKPMVMVPFIENTRNEEYMKRLETAGVPILPPAVYAFKIIKYLTDFIQYHPEDHDLTQTPPDPSIHASDMTKTAYSEYESKQILKGAGIATPKEAVAKTEAEAISITKEIGYPVVLKIDSQDILHKSDAGCVFLGIENQEELINAYHRILENAKKYDDNARIGGVLIQELLPKGLEIIIGITSDPQFGPAILCGLGGIYVEIFRDYAMAMAPVSQKEALQMLQSLKSFKMFQGFRGSKKLDITATADLIVRVSQLASEQKDSIAELDINPVLVYEKGLAVADALCITYGES